MSLFSLLHFRRALAVPKRAPKRPDIQGGGHTYTDPAMSNIELTGIVGARTIVTCARSGMRALKGLMVPMNRSVYL